MSPSAIERGANFILVSRPSATMAGVLLKSGGSCGPMKIMMEPKSNQFSHRLMAVESDGTDRLRGSGIELITIILAGLLS